MVTVVFFGAARIAFGVREIVIEAKSVSELLKKIAEKFNITYKQTKQYLCFVNEENITSLKMWRTKLSDGDKVMLLSPSSGG